METIVTSCGIYYGCRKVWPNNNCDCRYEDENGDRVCGKVSHGVYMNGAYVSNIAIDQLKSWFGIKDGD